MAVVGVDGSAVPWKAMTGTGRVVGHGVGRRRPATGATAAYTLEASQASWLPYARHRDAGRIDAGGVYAVAGLR